MALQTKCRVILWLGMGQHLSAVWYLDYGASNMPNVRKIIRQDFRITQQSPFLTVIVEFIQSFNAVDQTNNSIFAMTTINQRLVSPLFPNAVTLRPSWVGVQSCCCPLLTVFQLQLYCSRLTISSVFLRCWNIEWFLCLHYSNKESGFNQKYFFNQKNIFKYK